MRPEYLQKVAIVGVAESQLGRTNRTELMLHAEAALKALADAGIPKSEVDGLLSMGNSRLLRHTASAVAEYLGIRPVFSDSTCVGGASFGAMVNHAAAAIHAGICNTCLITYGSSQLTDSSRKLGGHSAEPWQPATQYETTFGLPSPSGAYAMAAQRYMHLYGATGEDLAEVAVAARQWASMNPVAYKRDPITVADVLNSTMITTPLHKLDCCLVTDGGGAVVITRMDRARSLPKPPITILGAAETVHHFIISQMQELTESPAHSTAQRAFAMAGLKPAEMDVVQIYDSFTITVLLTLEALGFCGRGEAKDFVKNGRIQPGGAFPLNTQGGGLSYCHPGMFGIFLIIELVRQLRGESGPRQVEGAEVGICHATGGSLSAHSTLILGRD